MAKIKNKIGQAFSTDILVVIVIILFGALFLVMNAISQAEQDNVQDRVEASGQEARILVDELRVLGILGADNRIDAAELMTLDKDEIKRKLDIENDFAIVFEKEGQLVKIDPEEDINCIGSDAITVNGVECR